MWEKVGEVNSTKAYITNGKAFHYLYQLYEI
jgi:hypothetical protein